MEVNNRARRGEDCLEGPLSQRKVPPSGTSIIAFNQVDKYCVVGASPLSFWREVRLPHLHSKSSSPRKGEHSGQRLTRPTTKTVVTREVL